MPLINTNTLNNSARYSWQKWLFSNIFAASFIVASLIFFGWGDAQLETPVHEMSQQAINLDGYNLFFYSARTMLRMIIGIIISVIFSVCYATLAIKSKKAEQVLIPILDILQSVPILGYMSFTVAGFVSLAPDTVLGFEMVAIFAIFTAQAWNITFSVYQSLKSIPPELLEVADSYHLNSWRKFWLIEIPYCIPGIVWNMIISMSGAWFFVVAAESFQYANMQIQLPGIGSFIAVALDRQNFYAIAAAVFSMILIIFSFDKLIFRALVVWSNKFKYDSGAHVETADSLIYTILSDSMIVKYIHNFFNQVARIILNIPFPCNRKPHKLATEIERLQIVWYVFLSFITICALTYVVRFLHTDITWQDVLQATVFTLITSVRVLVLLSIASVIWIPVGIYIGNRPALCSAVQPVVQFLAAFPANLFFPMAFIYIKKYDLDPDIWLSPLMVIASQWYILFNVIAGTAQIPSDIREVCATFKISGWLRYKKLILPAIMPYYVTGLITAAGASWNASIVSEAVTWGGENIYAHGIGAYITQMTAQNDFHRIALGVIVMSLFVVILNKIFWSPLYNYTSKKFSYT
jgi:NitT/TauT family transport system permease protein